MPSTTIVKESMRAPGDAAAAEVTALVVAWSQAEPERVGEVAVLAAGGAEAILGRGAGEDPSEPRVRFFRQRPGTLEPTAALASSGISRRQLVVRPEAEGARVERIGQCALEVNGQRCDAATVRAGDVIHLRRELVLLCTRRQALIPPPRLFPPSAMRAFGEPDGVGILGESPLVWRLREAIAFAAKADTHVLVLGDTGTGKELAARAVHAVSSRAPRAFVARNAATLPVGLVDAELFGNAKNYPNAGMPERPGLIGGADGGTLFLDEIGELPTELQAHLLRVLDSDGEYQRLGEASVKRSTFRLVAATNRDPSALKHDFLARLTSVVELAPLAARREDIPLLAAHLLRRAAKRSPEIAGRFLAGDRPRLEPALVVHLLRRDYPSNIRELDAVLWRAMAESAGDVVELPSQLRESAPPPSTPSGSGRAEAPVQPPSTPLTPRPEPTADEIRVALAENSGSVPRAARALGLSSRYALYRLMKKHDILPPSGGEC